MSNTETAKFICKWCNRDRGHNWVAGRFDSYASLHIHESKCPDNPGRTIAKNSTMRRKLGDGDLHAKN